jgi:hypothetical protein
MTAVGIGVLGLLTTAVYGLIGADLSRHISFGIFSSLIVMLAHSMMMFYLIGKGKAVKDALKEGGHSESAAEYQTYVRRISVARRPVFSVGPLAMLVTVSAAILGASVDTGSLPAIVHALIAYGAIACNFAAVKVEIEALSESSRVVDDVNRLLEA